MRSFSLSITLALLVLTACGPKKPVVVVYCSQDQVYAEPILQEFEDQTGIQVLPKFDSEAVKTVGLAKQLLAEKQSPVCDVFWSNEELRTRELTEKGVLESWSPTVFRTRRIVINTNLVDVLEAPESFEELAEPKWRDRVAVAFPFAGTTATHFHALRTLWGEDRWLDWIDALSDNDIRLVDGNSLVVQLVGRGEVGVGMTDIDDIRAGQRNGLPIKMLEIAPDAIAIRNAVAITKNAPHPEAAQQLFDFLTSAHVSARLVEADAAEGMQAPTHTVLDESQWKQTREGILNQVNLLKERFLRE